MGRGDRRAKSLHAIKRQLKIALLHGLTKITPGKFRKRHALDCGNPRCLVCGNPRKLWKQIPVKERLQDERDY